MAAISRMTIRGTKFEVIHYRSADPKEGRYYRVAAEDASSPVGFVTYINRFKTKAKAVGFARSQARAFAFVNA